NNGGGVVTTDGRGEEGCAGDRRQAANSSETTKGYEGARRDWKAGRNGFERQGAHAGLFFARAAASLMASMRERGSPRPVPALAKSVPCSTEVRMMGRPRVTFTPRQMPSILAATCPWS